MASDLDFVNFVVEQLYEVGNITHRKMFGEYMVYVNQKPVILVCDNTVYVKKLDCVSELLKNAETGFPYNGAKEHYILDVDDSEQMMRAVIELEKVTPIPKKKTKKK